MTVGWAPSQPNGPPGGTEGHHDEVEQKPCGVYFGSRDGHEHLGGVGQRQIEWDESADPVLWNVPRHAGTLQAIPEPGR